MTNWAGFGAKNFKPLQLVHHQFGFPISLQIKCGRQIAVVEARVRGGVVAGAIVGGVVAGALIAGASRRAHAHGCYDGPKRCEWRNRHCYENRWGETVCRGGEYRCWRPRICD